MADRVQVEQVIINLVRNAIEAMHETPPPGRLLHITSHSRAGVVAADVNDRGHGIPDPERIFDAFYTTKKDGMGMGLAICRSIIEAHGGHISAKSTPGEGSSVGFTLPVLSEPDARVGQ
jgi:signal transduction histidine kinase